MVQLQKDLAKLEKAGIQVVAISYDPAKSLVEFAKKRKITYPLLADPASRTIKAFGIYNKEAHRFIQGVPYPGTFIVNEKGVITGKVFHKGYRKRHSTEELIKAAK